MLHWRSHLVSLRNAVHSALGCLLIGFFIAMAQESVAEAENHVTIYSTYGFHSDGVWHIPVRVWVHEKPDALRRLVAKAARKVLHKKAEVDDLSEMQKERFAFRTEGFIADSESGETIVLVFDGDTEAERFTIKDTESNDETDRNGLIESVLKLPDSKVQSLLLGRDNNWVQLRVVSDDHQGTGWVQFIESEGLSIISDIDDTVKVTEIPSGEVLVLRNTFFREFMAAPCMVSLYQEFGDNTAFHYVSGGPWQLYAPLAQFLTLAGFPRGSFHMKSVRTNPFESESYSDIWRLLAGGSKQATIEQKSAQIGELLERFPERRFILIGDSGEHDPEIFSAVRDRYPDQVQEIRIRDVVNDQIENPSRLQDIQVIDPVRCTP